MKVYELLEQLKDTPFNKYKVVETSFGELEKLDYTGVYILCEKQTDEIVYIGSAYSKGQMLKGRLSCHISKTKKSSLRRHITKEYKGDIDHAVWYIKSLRLYVIECQDVEQALIEIVKPKYNIIHKGKTNIL